MTVTTAPTGTEILERVENARDRLKELAPRDEKLNRLSEESVEVLNEIGVMKMYQRAHYGGFESDPAEFAEVVMRIARYNSAAGWVGGVVGVHPWQISGFATSLQEAIWGEDPDTWVSSPYAPLGMLEPADGGYRIKGRIPFGSGGEACAWAINGALLKTDDGVQMRHIVLPRDDYRFDQDSWNVLGLGGTGSKDEIVDDAFVSPDRIYDPLLFENGEYFAEVGVDSPLYKLPFPVIFSLAINSATQGVAEGAMDAVIENTRQRVDARGTKSLDDNYQLAMIGECAADVRAGHTVIVEAARRIMDEVLRDGKLSTRTRIEVRTDGARSVRRSVEAVEKVFNYAGGMAVKWDHPANRGLRDAKTTLAHICNIQHNLYQEWSRVTFGLDHDKVRFFW